MYNLKSKRGKKVFLGFGEKYCDESTEDKEQLL
jgi:hypothetical protein